MPEPLVFMCEHPTNHRTPSGQHDGENRLTAKEYYSFYNWDFSGDGPALCAVCVSREHASHAF